MKNYYFFCFIRKLLALLVMSNCFIVLSLTVQAGELEPVGNYCFAFGNEDSFAEEFPLIFSAFSIDSKYFPIYGEYFSNPISGSGLFDKDENTLKITFTTSQLEELYDGSYPSGINIYMRVFTLLLNLNEKNWEGNLQLFSVREATFGDVAPPDNAPKYIVESHSGYVKKIPCN